MSMPEEANKEIYLKYFPVYGALEATSDKLLEEIEALIYVVHPQERGAQGPAGFPYDAYFFTEMKWLVMIQDQVNSIKGLREILAFYQANNVTKMKNKLLRDLEVAGMHDVYDWIS